jgi:secondary thiamine-phosphate synthase enzyme
MKQEQHVLSVPSPGIGLHDISAEVARLVRSAGIRTGMCHVFVRHTSASLLIQENADPSARRDLERWFERHVPEGNRFYSHTAEGADDMPSHIRAALTSTSELIPIVDGRLGLGTWQGLYLFEHRRRKSNRELVVSLWGE